MNKQQKLDELQAERKKLFELIRPLQERLSENYQQIETLQIEIDKERIANFPEDLIDIDFILTKPKNDSHVALTERQRQASLLNLSVFGFDAESDQNCIEIALYKNDDAHTQSVYEGLMRILPKIKVSSDGLKHIGLLEHTLSKYEVLSLGIYNLPFGSIGDCSLLSLRYHRKSVIKSFPNLLDLLKYCQQRHWYETSKK